MQPQTNQAQLKQVLFVRMIMLFVITAVVLVLFRSLPDLDFSISRHFLTVQDCPDGSTKSLCGRFRMLYEPTLNAIRDVSLALPYIMGAAIALYLLYQIVFERQTTAAQLQKTNLVIWTVLLAPVVLINLILKELWGRPRPFQVEGLGGDNPFVLPGTISDYCANNCSFVSGEASSATWLFTFLVFLDKRWRWPVGLLIGVYLVFFSGLRIAFGRHFLSDVVMSSLFTLCIFAGLYYLFSTTGFSLIFEKFARFSNRHAVDWRKK